MITTALLLSLTLTLIYLLTALLPLTTLLSFSNASASTLREKKFSITIVENTANNSPDRTIISLSSDTALLQIESHTTKQIPVTKCIDLLA